MNRQRNVALAVIAVLVVAGFVVGQLTGNDGAGDRLLASGPATTARTPGARAGSTTTVAGAPAGPSSDAATGSTTATDGAGASTTTAGAGAGQGSPSTTTTTTTTPSAAAAGGSPGGGSVTGGGGRTSGIGGGGVTGGIVEGGASSTGSSTTVAAEPDPAPGPQTHALTSADSGKTVAVKVNDLITLTLDPSAGMYWSDPVSDGPAVALAVSSRLERAVVASFTAVSPGTANLTAATAGTCTTANPPCVAPPVNGFKVTITVTS